MAVVEVVDLADVDGVVGEWERRGAFSGVGGVKKRHAPVARDDELAMLLDRRREEGQEVLQRGKRGLLALDIRAASQFALGRCCTGPGAASRPSARMLMGEANLRRVGLRRRL